MPYNHSIKAASPSGTAYTGRADGMFSLNEQVRFKSAGVWATAISAPGAPTGISAVAFDSYVTISFTAPVALNGSAIVNYVVTASPGNITASGTSSPISVTGLTNDTNYTFTVQTNSVSGYSVASSSVLAIPVSPPYAPSAPTNAVATRVIGSSTDVSVSFTTPSDLGRSTVSLYTVTSSNGQTATGTYSPIIISVVNGVANTFTVKLTNTAGYTGLNSAASNSLTISVGTGSSFSIGQSVAGGYYAGQINDAGVTYNLFVAPKATGFVSSYNWFNDNTTTAPAASRTLTNSPAASAALATASANYSCATFCENLTIGSYTDWYLPARDELIVAANNLKPSTQANVAGNRPATGYGGDGGGYFTTNNAVPPITSRKGMTSASLFQSTGSECFPSGGNCQIASSTENTAGLVWFIGTDAGYDHISAKVAQFSYSTFSARAMRRVAA